MKLLPRRAAIRKFANELMMLYSGGLTSFDDSDRIAKIAKHKLCEYYERKRNKVH